MTLRLLLPNGVGVGLGYIIASLDLQDKQEKDKNFIFCKFYSNIPCAITISYAIVGSNQFYLRNEFSEPFHRLPKSGEDLFTFLNTEFLDPIKGIEGFLCPGIDILGDVYNIATLFGASD